MRIERDHLRQRTLGKDTAQDDTANKWKWRVSTHNINSADIIHQHHFRSCMLQSWWYSYLVLFIEVKEPLLKFDLCCWFWSFTFLFCHVCSLRALEVITFMKTMFDCLRFLWLPRDLPPHNFRFGTLDALSQDAMDSTQVLEKFHGKNDIKGWTTWGEMFGKSHISFSSYGFLFPWTFWRPLLWQERLNGVNVVVAKLANLLPVVVKFWVGAGSNP